MPRPYVEPRHSNDEQKKWVKLNDLRAGKYPVISTMEKMQSYEGQSPKLAVYLELLVDGDAVMTAGNGKLRQMCEGSHIHDVEEGWVLEVRGLIGTGKFSTRDVDLYVDEATETLEHIPF